MGNGIHPLCKHEGLPGGKTINGMFLQTQQELHLAEIMHTETIKSGLDKDNNTEKILTYTEDRNPQVNVVLTRLRHEAASRFNDLGY